MASAAWTTFLVPLLDDAAALNEAHRLLAGANPVPTAALDATNRAVVVTCVSAWEAYDEELASEAVRTMRPASPPSTHRERPATLAGIDRAGVTDLHA